jgi:hypothetical protein
MIVNSYKLIYKYCGTGILPVNLNYIQQEKIMLNDQFLEIITQEMFPEGKENDETRLFPLRWHPKHFDKPSQGKRNQENTILGEWQKLGETDPNYAVAPTNISQLIKRLVNNYFLPNFQEEMVKDHLNLEEFKQQTAQQQYLISYHWLWEQKFPREAWYLAKKIALNVQDELKMIPIEVEKGVIRKTSHLAKDKILQKNTDYQIQLDLPNNGYLLLINEDAEGNQFLITPSKAFAEIPTQLSHPLFLPPDTKLNEASIVFETDKELFLGIITSEAIKLSWMDENYLNNDVQLDQKRLEEIFIKVGKLPDCKLFKRQFLVN